MKSYILFFLMFILACVPVEEEPDVSAGVTVTNKRLQSDLQCMMKSVYGKDPVEKKRTRTLDFISDRLAQKFNEYQVDTHVKRAHLLAQMTHESDGFSATVERRLLDSWRELFKGDSASWNCRGYLDAVNEDDHFFNHVYRYSKNAYKSKFRGRGLIQLTGCFNYLGFLYHKSALENDEQGKADLHKTYFTYETDAGRAQVGMFCSDEVIEQMDNSFKQEGLSLNPSELLNGFEETVDELSLPCSDRGVSTMTSAEFIVDSSLWYWKKCQSGSYYKEYVGEDSDKAVARMSECVHGKHRTYQNYASINCSVTQSDWRKQSFCNRRKAYRAAVKCLSRSDEEALGKGEGEL